MDAAEPTTLTSSVAAKASRYETAESDPEIGLATTFQPQLHGVARPYLSATMRSLTAGSVARVHVKEGQPVRDGDPLITMDDRLGQAQLRIAEIQATREGDLNRALTQLRLAEQQLSRLEMAFARHALSDFEVEEQRARVEEARATHQAQLELRELAQANHAMVQEQVRRLTVVAPFDGIVTQLHAKLGESVGPSMPVVSVANLQELEIEMHTPVDLYGSLRPGAQVLLTASAPVHATLTADVTFTSPIINSASGTFRCRLRIDNSKRQLPAGFTVTLPPARQGTSPRLPQ